MEGRRGNVHVMSSVTMLPRAPGVESAADIVLDVEAHQIRVQIPGRYKLVSKPAVTVIGLGEGTLLSPRPLRRSYHSRLL